MGAVRAGRSALLDAIEERGWRLRRQAVAAPTLPSAQLDTALRLAADLAGERCEENMAGWREALFTEARRRLFPEIYAEPTPELERVAEFFFSLAGVVLREQARGPGGGIVQRLPFVPLAEEEIARWPSGEEYRRMLRHVADDAVLVAMAMAQEWRGLTLYEHVLGVTGLSLWVGRQLARVAAVDLPLLHGAAIGHDIGKFGCVGDEVRRIPRLHYYYTNAFYADRGLPGLGHIATNHSVWDLELVRLPVETLLLIYADFRVKEWPDDAGRERMRIISLGEAFDAIRNKLENPDKEKIRRYRGVYRKLRDLEEYLQFLGVELDPPGFTCPQPPRPALPAELDVTAVLAGRERPDAVALVAGRKLAAARRLFVTAHNLGVMERLRDQPALRALLEEARSFERWRDLRTYLAILGEYSPALSREQKSMALDFFLELLSHRDDDIRYHAANRIADLLASREDFWRKDLPAGIVLRPERTMLDELERVLSLLDLAGPAPEEDMAATERVLYAIPIVVRRLLRKAGPDVKPRAWELVKSSLAARLGDPRPLVGLYVCEALEASLSVQPAGDRAWLLQFAAAWMEHPVLATRLMAWLLLAALARERDRELAAEVRRLVERLGATVGESATVAELHLLQELAAACGLRALAERCRAQRLEGRDPVREVFLRNLKSRVDWVEKKVNCDYLTAAVLLRHQEDRDPGSYFASEVASHFANLLKVSRVEGTRFHAGRCLLRLLPLLTVPQRNDLTVELLRSLELDAESVTRYIPRFLGPVLASLPEQEFLEALEDVEGNARRGTEPLQRLLLQTAGWVLLSLGSERAGEAVLRRLAGIILGALAETRPSTVHEGFAQVAMVMDRLSRAPRDDGRLRALLALATKKLLALVTHRHADRVRFFLVASALSHLDRALGRLHPPVRFPERPSVAFIPGTFDPFTTAHQAVVAKALENADEAVVQMDDYSWRKHALPRQTREELAWMALAAVPEAHLAPFRPPVNLASRDGLRHLRRAFGRRRVVLVVGSDVLAGASAYGKEGSEIWRVPHVVVMRDGAQPEGLLDRIGRFRRGVAVVPAPPRAHTVSSTSLRAALDRHEDVEALCHPLVARTLVERRLYVNYPASKQPVAPPADRLVAGDAGAGLPPGLATLAELGAAPAADFAGRGRCICVLTPGDGGGGGGALAALAWRPVSAAALPVVLGEEELAAATEGRLVGQGALVERVAAAPGADEAVLERLLSDAIARWLDAGLLFAMLPLGVGEGGPLRAAAAGLGAATVGLAAAGERSGGEVAVFRLTRPLVMVMDLESILQPPYAASPRVRSALAAGRRAASAFFAALAPGDALLQLNEDQLKRRLVESAAERLAEGGGRKRVVLGLGWQFSRDIVGDAPTIAVELERVLTWQGYEGGLVPLHGSPPLQLQLAVARELARNAILLVPFLDSAEPVIQTVATAREVGVTVREVLIGVTDAAVRATLELRGIPHRCTVVVPGWHGVLRESAVAPFLGGWSIVGRAPLETGSLIPSLNDCLPYHYPHHLGLANEAALDFSRLALHQARQLLLAIEETFREREGRLLSVRDLGAVVRVPRCPPFPEGFLPPRERFPSELLADDIEALARLHPATHAAHRRRWRET
ncbi:MAG TPA: adenylyltransferase/cytidyltransferase family protein [Thermoanaerobaculaceae bacterium]|nr:adenylyltransferase/cytidyltransferase family protein [Thermoanaerobaculaceae bacterium]